MNIAIVGCGLIGQKRAKFLGRNRLIACADINIERATAIACQHQNSIAFSDWHEAVNHPDVELVIVSTTPNNLAEITEYSLQSGKHVLVDKPVALNKQQIEKLIFTMSSCERQVRVGFNHRYHPAIAKAFEMVQADAIGKLMFIRGRYGHGGRIGYEQEWRADANVSGGGELIDQGMHLIDLSRWFLGEFPVVQGFIHTYFWNMPVEDNGFMVLRTAHNQVAWLHASWTEWKNLFSFEIFGKSGKLQIDGLGGSYGTEQLTYYKMSPTMGPPETTVWQFPEEDLSFQTEIELFVEDILKNRPTKPSLLDAKEVMQIVETIYKQNMISNK